MKSTVAAKNHINNSCAFSLSSFVFNSVTFFNFLLLFLLNLPLYHSYKFFTVNFIHSDL